MGLLKIIHQTSGKTIASKVEQASSLLRRTVGLMFRTDMGPIDGLMIERCNSVHTCFMRFPMDAAFLDSEDRIVKILRSMAPWRFSWLYWRACRVLELPAGALPPEIREGDRLEVISV